MVSFLDARPSSLLVETIALRSSPLSSLQGSVQVLGLDSPDSPAAQGLTSGLQQIFIGNPCCVLAKPEHIVGPQF